MGNKFLMVLFLVIMVGLVAGMQYYIYRKFSKWGGRFLQENSFLKYRKSVIAFLIIGNIFIIARIILSGTGGYQTLPGQVIAYGNGVFFAALIFAFLLLLIISIVKQFLIFIHKINQKISGEGFIPEYSENRRMFIKVGGQAVIGAVAATPIIMSLAPSRDFLIVRQPLYFKDLPSGLEGFTFAQISDIHSGIFMTENNMREIFEIVNGLHPQLITVTGDFVDNNVNEIPAITKAITDLKADYGVFGSLGNHDHYAGAEKVFSALKSKINLLKNEHRALAINGEKLSIIGVDDAGRGTSHFADLHGATRGMDPESFTLLMSHRPRFFHTAAEHGIDLTLSGHTHGGQVVPSLFGMEFNVAAMVHDYVAGHYTKGPHQLYVNVGVGMVGVPMRTVRPEITLFTLKRG